MIFGVEVKMTADLVGFFFVEAEDRVEVFLELGIKISENCKVLV